MQSSKVIMGKMEEACKVSYYLRRADTVYGCAYQDASIKPINAWKWFYARSNNTTAHKLS